MNFFNQLDRCYLIAEIGVNHNGDMNLAREMIDEAKGAGADAVKFQTFTAQKLVSSGTPKVKYQERTTDQTESHYQMIERLELSKENHFILKDYTESCGLDFISTPYDLESAQFLAELEVKLYKTASADLVDLPLQEWIAATGKPAIVSVGMATMGEIERVVDIYRKAGNNHLILLHCVSNYPCRDESLNLNVLHSLKQAFDLPIGYSDHSIGAEAAIISTAFGAKVIEKHFTTDKTLPGPDHKASSTPDEFKYLTQAVRRAEKMLGSTVKKCQEEERQMAQVSRKSIFLARDIKKGERFTLAHLEMKRPGTGLNSYYLELFLNRAAARDITATTMLDYSDLSHPS